MHENFPAAAAGVEAAASLHADDAANAAVEETAGVGDANEVQLLNGSVHSVACYSRAHDDGAPD